MQWRPRPKDRPRGSWWVPGSYHPPPLFNSEVCMRLSVLNVVLWLMVLASIFFLYIKPHYCCYCISHLDCSVYWQMFWSECLWFACIVIVHSVMTVALGSCPGTFSSVHFHLHGSSVWWYPEPYLTQHTA